jgi:hypothetical protein
MRLGHGTWDNDRPPVPGVVCRDTGKRRREVVRNSGRADLEPRVVACTDRLVKLGDAAEFLGRCQRSVGQKAGDGVIPSVKTGGARRSPLNALAEWSQRDTNRTFCQRDQGMEQIDHYQLNHYWQKTYCINHMFFNRAHHMVDRRRRQNWIFVWQLFPAKIDMDATPMCGEKSDKTTSATGNTPTWWRIGRPQSIYRDRLAQIVGE